MGDGLGFDSEFNALEVHWRGGSQRLELAPKEKLARQLVELIAAATEKKPRPSRAGPPRKPLRIDMTLEVSPSLFRAYDIRGVVGKTLTAPVVHRIGLAIGAEAALKGERAIVVGRDGRRSSPELAAGPDSGSAGERARCDGHRHGAHPRVCISPRAI